MQKRASVGCEGKKGGFGIVGGCKRGKSYEMRRRGCRDGHPLRVHLTSIDIVVDVFVVFRELPFAVVILVVVHVLITVVMIVIVIVVVAMMVVVVVIVVMVVMMMTVLVINITVSSDMVMFIVRRVRFRRFQATLNGPMGIRYLSPAP